MQTTTRQTGIFVGIDRLASFPECQETSQGQEEQAKEWTWPGSISAISEAQFGAQFDIIDWEILREREREFTFIPRWLPIGECHIRPSI